jgi:hypothetical protein
MNVPEQGYEEYEVFPRCRHPKSAEHYTRDSRGYPYCRTCRRERERTRYQQKKLCAGDARNTCQLAAYNGPPLPSHMTAFRIEPYIPDQEPPPPPRPALWGMWDPSMSMREAGR